MAPAPRYTTAAALLALARLAAAQEPGNSTAEVHPKLTTWKCTTAGGCVEQDTSVVLDWNYRWIHSGSTSCTTSSGVDSSLCPDEATCAQNCVVEGANYTAAGVSTSGDTLTMYQYVNKQNASPRLYLLGSDGDYEMLYLLGQELTFDVDLSTLPCGENGALYLSEMDKTGGRSEYNEGGANYGSGYCDAQCPVQTWRNGTLNTSGQGYCCNEMDILESNARANAFTPHPCGATDCDRGGCGFNPYAQGYTSYYGPGLTLDTSQKFTAVTRFYTDDGTTSGTLSHIDRVYYQNGQKVASAVSTGDTITASWCVANSGSAATYGGLPGMGEALGRGMVLIFSIWNDASQYMNWLDSGSSGPCSDTEGNPSTILSNYPDTHVVFSNIRWGDIGSTTGGTGGTGGGGSSSSSTASKTSSTTSKASSTTSKASTTTATTTSQPSSSTTTKTSTTTTSSSGATQTHWGQCGGQGYSGPTVCASPYTCTYSNPYYSQCL